MLVLNTKNKSLKYYDPIGIENNDNVICNQLFALLKREINEHEHDEIENTRWQRLEYERINEIEDFDHIDSAIYMIQQGFRIATCKDIEVKPENLLEYRKKLLYQLFKYEK